MLVLKRLVKRDRKAPVLRPPEFGCLKGIPTINITSGCLHSCTYCYARGFSDAPPRGEVHLYKNTIQMLESELSRKKKLPVWVSFSTASDAFQDIDEVLEASFQAMRLLLERGIGVSFLTKGYIPSEFISLFNKYRNQVKARIGIVSLNDDYWRLFEPGTAHPFKRLLNIRNLMNAGIEVSVRIDPIIPSVSGSFESLIKRLKILGVRDITISHLIMRPSIMNQMFTELPLSLIKKIIKLYQGQPLQRVITSAKTRPLPKEIRLRELDELKSISKRYGIECRYCGCKNPDLPKEFCSPWVELRLPEVKSNQMSLFM